MTRPDWELETPVALLIFNRPETTRRVFETIRAVRPRRLLVVADGPRPGRAGEEQRCREARSVIDSVDWECTIETDYAEQNLGCGRRVSSGLDWVFRQVEEAIILEDDCLPHPSFFRFCQELLVRFRDEPGIAQIAGANFQRAGGAPLHSYYFSNYNHIWGWASWRRAWALNDNTMAGWPEFRDRNLLAGIVSGRKELSYWTEVLNKVHAGEIDTWDCQWTFSCWQNRLLTVIPAQNLISNIGFGPGATHTPVPNRYAAMETAKMEFPLIHPLVMEADCAADAYTGKTMYREASLVDRVVAALRGFS
jgi:hypothetical protein